MLLKEVTNNQWNIRKFDPTSPKDEKTRAWSPKTAQVRSLASLQGQSVGCSIHFMKAGYTELKGCDFSAVKGTQDGAVSFRCQNQVWRRAAFCASMVNMKKGNVISQKG